MSALHCARHAARQPALTATTFLQGAALCTACCSLAHVELSASQVIRRPIIANWAACSFVLVCCNSAPGMLRGICHENDFVCLPSLIFHFHSMITYPPQTFPSPPPSTNLHPTPPPPPSPLARSLAGVAVIRAFSQQQRFCLRSEQQVDVNNSVDFHSVAAGMWMGLLLDLIAAVLIAAAAYVLLFLPPAFISPGAVPCCAVWCCEEPRAAVQCSAVQ